ncbi:MAG: alkaline phosphatase family protein [Sphingomonadales bacterium]
MSARVLFIGLDAASGALIHRFCREGVMPTFAGLERDGAVCRLSSPLTSLPGAIWPEISTGISSGRMGEFYHPGQLHTGEARIRPIRPEDTDPERYFWTRASRAGRRVAAIDMPQTTVMPDLNGVQLCEWGLHDRNFGIACHPPGLLEELRSRHGDHPIQATACDTVADRDGLEALLEGLLRGVRAKTGLLIDVMEREPWDLFACVYGETHCGGHQFWHLLDKSHPRHPADAPPRLLNAMRRLYSAIDEGMGRVIERAGPDVTVMALASHGIGPYVGGTQLLPEVLSRLGMAAAADTPARRRLRALHGRARYLPRGIKQVLRRALGLGALRRAQASLGVMFEPFESPATRAGVVRNNRCGAIRLNLRGREPFGSVTPGTEADAVVDELRAELLALTQPGTGRTIIDGVDTAEEVFGADRHSDVPDLIVRFRADIGPIEACTSPRIGTVAVPINSPGYPRTGDHVPNTRLWAMGPGIAPGRRAADGSVLDIAPTILGALGVPAAAGLDGRPLGLRGD